MLEWSPDSGVLQSLESLQRALSLKEAEAADLQQQLAAAPDDLARDEIRRRLQEVRNAIEDQRRQFDGFAVDVDLSPFTPQTESKFDWQEQVGKLLEPILAEFENATAETRVIGQIRTQLNSVRKRRTSRRKPSTIWRRCWAGRLRRNCKRA